MYKIGILFQNRDFEHDVYELIKAFYPGNEIVSFYEEDDADYDIRFRVSRDEEGYTISYNNGIEKETAHGAVIEGQSSGEASDALFLAMMPMISAEKIKTRSNTLCIRCFPKLQERHFPGESYRHPSCENGYGNAGVRNEEYRDRQIYERTVSGKPGENSACSYHCQP